MASRMLLKHSQGLSFITSGSFVHHYKHHADLAYDAGPVWFPEHCYTALIHVELKQPPESLRTYGS